MRLAIVGCGSIGSVLAKAADEMDEVKRVYLMDSKAGVTDRLCSELKKAQSINSIEQELYHCDLVIEAANQTTAKELVPKVLGRGVDIMVMSVGALVDDDYRKTVYAMATKSGARIMVPSGAICGTDGLSSASIGKIDSVELITTKGPHSLVDVPYFAENNIDINSLTKPTAVYCGKARDAVRIFPKNVNVAATVSLMGIGFDRTKVTVILDPDAVSNSHELRVKGEFGEMNCKTSNVPSPDNPSTSHLAALSAISALKRVIRNEWVGI